MLVGQLSISLREAAEYLASSLEFQSIWA